MRVACLGSGYVGAPNMVVMASKCPDITFTVLDANESRVQAWNSSNNLPIFEPGLLELVKQCRGKNLFFSTDAFKHMKEADVIFVSVQTPTKVKGVGAGKAANLFYWEAAARLISAACREPGFKIVVEKSTVPVHTAEAMGKVLLASQPPGVHFEILSNPHFAPEGSAVEDLTNPDRVLIGGRATRRGPEAVEVLRSIYARWVPPSRILTMDLWSAELSKLAANAFLAQRLSSINAISALCEETGADIQQVSEAVGADSRIGPHFLRASMGFGGSTFQKDILNLVYICQSLQLSQVAAYWQRVMDLNEWQKQRFVQRLTTAMFNTITGKRIAVLGFAFKRDTCDTRDSPARDICYDLVHGGAQLSIYDPKVPAEQVHYDMTVPKSMWETPRSPRGTSLCLQTVEVAKDAYEACSGAHALCVLTDWEEFRALDFPRIHASMLKPAFIFDGRGLLDPEALRALGFVVYSLGRPLEPFLVQGGLDEYLHLH